MFQYESANDMYDNFTRAYKSADGSSYVPLAKITTTSPELFLFGSSLNGRIGPPNVENPLRKCNSFRQCVPSPFTRNFTLVTRTIPALVAQSASVVTYENQNTFICGAIGFLNKDNSKCVLDKSIFPLYNLFCDVAYRSQYAGCSQWALLASVRVDRCSRVVPLYEPKYSAIVDNVNALADLFFMFQNTFETYYDIMKTTDCALDIYQHVTSNPGLYATRTLYYPMAFIVKEFPFDWFYQCILLNTNPVLYPDIKSNQNCPAYKGAVGAPTTNADGSVNLLEYLRVARAGFSFSVFEDYYANMTTRGSQVLIDIANQIVNSVFPDQLDGSVPTCSRYRIWKTGLSDIQNMLIYNNYNPYNCHASWQRKIIDIINTYTNSVSFSSAYEAAEIVKILDLSWDNVDSLNPKEIVRDFDVNNWRLYLSETYMGVPESIPWVVVQVVVERKREREIWFENLQSNFFMNMLQFLTHRNDRNHGLLQPCCSIQCKSCKKTGA